MLRIENVNGRKPAESYSSNAFLFEVDELSVYYYRSHFLNR